MKFFPVQLSATIHYNTSERMAWKEPIKRTKTPINIRTNEQSNERTTERTNERTTERTNEQTNERTTERTNQQPNERTNKRVYAKVKRQQTQGKFTKLLTSCCNKHTLLTAKQ